MKGHQTADRISLKAGTILAALLLATAWGMGTPAAGVRALPLDEVARQADVVFVGTVVDIRTRWGDTGKLIWTDYIFRVHETWKGAPGELFRTVSVGGGTIGEKTFLLSEVPSFEKGGTYVVYAYDNARLTAEAVVGVEQGLFREVADASTGKPFLIDAQGYRMERLPNGCLTHGRLTQRVGDTQRARVLSDDDLVAQQESFERENGPASIDPPVVRDADGNLVSSGGPPPKSHREKAMEAVATHPAGEPLTREALREWTLEILRVAPEPAATKGGR
jgi:hypothetical protein